MKKTMFLTALLGAVMMAAPAMAAVTFSYTNVQYGDALTLGETTESSYSDIALTINVSALGSATATQELLYTHNYNESRNVHANWGFRVLSGGSITGKWQDGNYGNTTSYETISALANEGGTVTVLASVGNSGVFVTDMGTGTSLYSNSGLKSSSPDTDSYTVDGTGIVTNAQKVVSYEIGNFQGSGTLDLGSNAKISGGNNTDVSINMNGKSVEFTGNTTLNKVGSTNAAAGGITVKEGVTLTAAIESSWNPGNITLEKDAKIEADHFTLSTNAVSNVTGAGTVHVTGNVETYNGGKFDTSVSSFTVDGNVILGKQQAGANNDTVTISGGEFSVAGTTTVNSGRTLNVTGGTATFNDLVIGGTVNLTGGTTTINGTISLAGGVLNTTTAMAIETESLTLSAGTTITLGEDHDGQLTTSALTVNGNSTINADLVFAENSTLTFNGGSVTLGCSVDFGTGTAIALGDAYLEDLAANGQVLLFSGVDDIIGDLNTIAVSGNFLGGKVFSVRQEDGTHNIYATPEPATATLSLLALAGLMARRRRH